MPIKINRNCVIRIRDSIPPLAQSLNLTQRSIKLDVVTARQERPATFWGQKIGPIVSGVFKEKRAIADRFGLWIDGLVFMNNELKGMVPFINSDHEVISW
ncbi:hypothetical protein RRG08_026170 [Elysia crispata]|uniref:Uncharacterized protein n=1 Tax=Elysia crispata TaxID=231223 RepID=A0AAE0ZA62_9GAST|nr:hypothetical protein RRG08_026170 [Elysia crispata]